MIQGGDSNESRFQSIGVDQVPRAVAIYHAADLPAAGSFAREWRSREPRKGLRRAESGKLLTASAVLLRCMWMPQQLNLWIGIVLPLVLKALSADSTVKDLKQAQKQVRSAFAAVKQAASTLEDAKVEQLEQSQQNLEKAVNDIPDDSTLDEALASVSDKVESVSVARQELFSSANCNAQ